MRPFLAIAILIFANSAAVHAGEPTAELSGITEVPQARAAQDRTWRRHFVLTDKRENVHYHGTEIHSMTQKRNESALLLWDQGSGRGLRFQETTDFETKEVMYRIDETDGNAFVSVAFLMPFASKTRDAMLKEGRENPVIFETLDSAITVATNTYRRTASESQWADEGNARNWRSDIRSSMSATLLEQLERLRGGASATPVVNPYYELTMKQLFHGTTDAPPLLVVTAPADCRFDADMGHPCSDAQLQLVKEAEKAGKVLRVY